MEGKIDRNRKRDTEKGGGIIQEKETTQRHEGYRECERHTDMNRSQENQR